MLQQIEEVFRKVFDNPKLTISENTSAKDIKMWDSISHIELISELEANFKMRFTFDEVMGFRQVGDIIRTIKKRQTKN